MQPLCMLPTLPLVGIHLCFSIKSHVPINVHTYIVNAMHTVQFFMSLSLSEVGFCMGIGVRVSCSHVHRKYYLTGFGEVLLSIYERHAEAW